MDLQHAQVEVMVHPKRRLANRVLLTLTIFSVLFGSWLAIAIRRARHQQQICHQIRSLEGVVNYEYNDDEDCRAMFFPASKNAWPLYVDWIREVLGPDYVASVHSVVLQGQDISDTDIECLRDLRSLTGLDLAATSVTDAGLASAVINRGLTHLVLAENPQLTNKALAWVTGNAHLEVLDVSGTAITDEGLAELACMKKLSDLNLAGARISDAGVTHLKKLATLRLLDVSYTQLTDQGLMELRDVLPNCTVIRY